MLIKFIDKKRKYFGEGYKESYVDVKRVYIPAYLIKGVEVDEDWFIQGGFGRYGFKLILKKNGHEEYWHESQYVVSFESETEAQEGFRKFQREYEKIAKEYCFHLDDIKCL